MSLSPSLLLRSLRIPLRSFSPFSSTPPTTTSSSWASSTALPRDDLGAESAAAKEARERIERPVGWRSAKKVERRERDQRERERRGTVLNYEPTDSHWHTHLPPPLTSQQFSSLTPTSRTLHLACRTAFLTHQQSLFDSLVPFKTQSEWESLTPQEKVIRKEVQREKREALFGMLGEREERTMWAVVGKKEKERRKREGRKREKKEKERVKKEEVVEEELTKSEEVVKEESKEVKLEVEAQPPQAEAPPPSLVEEEEIENPWGAGIPLEARRGRRR